MQLNLKQKLNRSKEEWLDLLIRIMLEAYLVFLGLILPLYMYDGYYGIGFEKFTVWRKASLITAVTVLAALLARWLVCQKKELSGFRPMWNAVHSLSGVDICLILYAVFMTVSFVSSIDHEEALWGTFGWNMGYLTQILMVLFYFLYSRLYHWKTYSIAVLCSGAVAVMIIGIIQRFGYIQFNNGSGGYIYLSTIGNINWLAGYLSVFVPVLAAVFTGNRYQNKWISMILIILCGTGFFSLITNGSDSVYLILLAVFFAALILGIGDRETLKRGLVLICVFGICCELLNLLLMLRPEIYLSVLAEDGTISRFVTDHNTGLKICVIFSALYLLAEWEESHTEHLTETKRADAVIKAIIYICFAALTVFLFLQITGHTGLDDRWGTNRGAIWRISGLMYRKLPLYRKMFGVGPDCFAWYNLNDSEIRNMTYEIYAKDRLTNAHSELLSMMINTGVCTTAAFMGSLLVKCRHAVNGHDVYSYIALFTVAGVLAHFLVSFQHIILMPYVFIILSMGVKKQIQE